MGTPDFAVASLQAIAAAGHQVQRVYTQPDRPAGRGNKLRKPPVKVAAEELGLTIAQPQSLKGDLGKEWLADLKELNPDLIVVAAYGQILPKSILDLPRYGCINLHASILPRWRGASPIQAAIRAGDAETGITIMLMDEGLDTGAMLRKEQVPIGPNTTAGSLHDELAALAAQMVVPCIEAWAAGDLSAIPQENDESTYAPMLKKRDGEIAWEQDARTVCNHIRSMIPWPGAQTEIAGVRVRLGAAEIEGPSQAAPGTIFALENSKAIISTGSGAISVQEIHPAGKRVMSFSDFLSGRRLELPVQFEIRDSENGHE